VVSKAGSDFNVRDLGSSNGTALNGKLLKGESRLSPGDTLIVGKTRMKLLGTNGQLDEDELMAVDGPPSLDEIEEPEVLTEDDVAEPIGEEDVVDEGGSIDLLGVEEPLAVADSIVNPMADDESPIEMIHAAINDSDHVVEALAESLPEKPFGETDIALLGARSQTVHPSGGRPPATGQREPVDWLRLLLLICSRSRATDLHMEPKGECYLIRMRVDGTMVEISRVSNELGVRLSALVKVLSDIDISQRNAIQEGHFGARVPNSKGGRPRKIDYRVSFAPSVFGQKLVIRVLDTTYAPLHIRALQLPDWMCGEIDRVVRQDAGMVLVCGPTGSGKTTTLYALVRGSDVTHRNVVTIEDPVEIQIEGVTQVPVDESQDRTFSSLLRSMLRQDPDVILIGEIRDAETARIAMQAAITGHLVFSTVHTQNTIGTIFRLLDLGVEPYLVSQALHLVLAQRLVRQLCPYCKQPVKPTADQLTRMGPAAEGVTQLYAPRGCPRCLNTGFAGRRAVFELLTTNDKLRDLILKTPTIGEIQAALASTPFQRLHHSGYQMVADGLAAFEEIDRAIGRET
jgi:type II secretory ATPase GspE/PulE/Tfp pilus assembly ATPase PilB-like protein